MNKQDFFAVYRGWNDKLNAYYNDKLCQFTATQFSKLKDVIINVEGNTYKVSSDFVCKLS